MTVSSPTSAPSPTTAPAPTVARRPILAPAPRTAKGPTSASSPVSAPSPTKASAETPGRRARGGYRRSSISASARYAQVPRAGRAPVGAFPAPPGSRPPASPPSPSGTSVRQEGEVDGPASASVATPRMIRFGSPATRPRPDARSPAGNRRPSDSFRDAGGSRPRTVTSCRTSGRRSGGRGGGLRTLLRGGSLRLHREHLVKRSTIDVVTSLEGARRSRRRARDDGEPLVPGPNHSTPRGASPGRRSPLR